MVIMILWRAHAGDNRQQQQQQQQQGGDGIKLLLLLCVRVLRAAVHGLMTDRPFCCVRSPWVLN